MRILIADDHDLVRETISAYLEKEGGFDVSVSENLDAALGIVVSEPPFDLVLLDYAMPGMNGLDGFQRMRKQFPDLPIAILSGIAANNVAHTAVEAGAVGFVPKTMSAASMVNAVRFMIAGETFLPVSMLQSDGVNENPISEKLTTREREVLSGLCRGLSNKEIGRELELQEVTIKLHVRKLCRKLDVKNRTQAALLAKECGLF